MAEPYRLRPHHLDYLADGPAPPRPVSRDAMPGAPQALGSGRFSIEQGDQWEVTYTPAGGTAEQKFVFGAGSVRIRQNNAPRAKPRNRYEPGT
jgi:hypothetical protein